jgi:hypothetical protein
MTEAVIVGHPGRLFWEELVREHRRVSEDFPIKDGEMHVIVTERVARFIWDWVATQIADTRRTELPLTPEVAPEEQQKLAEVPDEPGVTWYKEKMPNRPFQVPVAPWIVIHPYKGPNSLLAKAFPAATQLTDSQYLVGWLTPYSRELYEKGKTYQDQPDDVHFPRALRSFSYDLVERYLR